MLKSSVLKIIQSFSKEEIADFNVFLKSPYFNKKSGVIKLYNEVKKYYPDFTNENLENEKLWNKLYPEKKYGYGVMKNLIFDITKLAEEFIAQENYRSDELQKLENIFKSLSQRKLYSLIENKSSYFTKKFSDEALKETSLSVENFFNHLTTIHELKVINKFFHNVTVNLTNDICEWQDVFITGMLIHLLNINDTSNNLTLENKGVSKTIQLTEIVSKYLPDELFEKVLNSIRKRSKVKYTLLNCYFLANKALISRNDSADYFRFKNFIFKHFKLLPLSCKSDMVDYLVNILELTTDVSLDRKNEQYELYLFRHKNNLFTDKYGQINSSYFVPHLTLLLHQGRLEVLEEFIAYYSDLIIDNEKDACILFAESVSLFMRSEFEKSFNIISKIKFNSFSLKNILKKFSMLLYYELNYYEEFKFSYDSHKHFLKYGDWDKKDLGYEFMIKRTKLFCDRIENLFKLKETSNILEIELFEKFLVENNIDYKRWFLKKINELKKSQAKLSA